MERGNITTATFCETIVNENYHYAEKNPEEIIKFLANDRK